MPTIAHTTMSSTRVKPAVRLHRGRRRDARSRGRGGLPLRISSPVQSDRLALRMYVENVDAVGGETSRAVAAGAGRPVRLPGDRIPREAPEILHFRPRHIPDVVPLVEPFQLFGVSVLVG